MNKQTFSDAKKIAFHKGKARELLILAVVEELFTWFSEPVLQVFVSDGEGGATERRVTLRELLRMEGGGKAVIERLAALRAIIELSESAGEVFPAFLRLIHEEGWWLRINERPLKGAAENGTTEGELQKHT